MRRALLSTLLLVFSVSTASAGRPFVRPDELGPFAVGHVQLSLVDETRDDRTLPVDVWYPVDPEDASGDAAVYGLIAWELASEIALDSATVSDSRRFPLVIFSHGSGGIRFQSFFLTELLASHGFIVVAPDHVGNTILDDLTGGETPFLTSATNRLRDVSFLISTMLQKAKDPKDPFYRTIRRKRIGVTGHSFGGFTSLGAAAGFSGEEIEELPDDFEPVPADRRVRAIVPLAPASGAFSDEELAGIRVPTLVIGGTLDDTTPVEPNSARPFELVNQRVVRVDLEDAVHFSFSNACQLVQVLLDSGAPEETVLDLLGESFLEGCGPDVLLDTEAHRITNLYTVAHFYRYLYKDERYDVFLSGVYARELEPVVTYSGRRKGKSAFAIWAAALAAAIR